MLTGMRCFYSFKRIAPISHTTENVAIISPMMVVNDSTITTCVSVILVHHGVSSMRSGCMSGDRFRGSILGLVALGSNGNGVPADPNGLTVGLELMDTAGDAGGVEDAAGGAAGGLAAVAESLASVGVGGLPLSNALSSASKSISLRSLSSSRRTCAAPSSNSGSAARTSVVLVRPCVPDEFRPFLRARALRGRAVRECAIIVIALIVSSSSKRRRENQDYSCVSTCGWRGDK